MSTAATSVSIRAGAPVDAVGIAGISDQGIAERSATFATDQATDADVRAWLGDDRRAVLVAELDGRVAGRLDGEWKDLLIVERLLGDPAAEA